MWPFRRANSFVKGPFLVAGGNYIEMIDNDQFSRSITSDSKVKLISLRQLDGVDWFHAPMPPKIHKCWAQTVGLDIGSLGRYHVRRCACGSISMDSPDEAATYGNYWMNRNERRTSS